MITKNHSFIIFCKKIPVLLTHFNFTKICVKNAFQFLQFHSIKSIRIFSIALEFHADISDEGILIGQPIKKNNQNKQNKRLTVTIQHSK